MIEFSVSAGWDEHPNDVAKVVLLTVTKSPTESFVPHLKDVRDPNSWQLDCGNNWWLKRLEPCKYRLTYRYMNPFMQPVTEAYKVILEYKLR